MFKLKILPYEHLVANNRCNELLSPEQLNMPADWVYHNSGKSAIHAIMELEGLNRDDEVFISTTTNSNFVSSCVTSTIFNYTKLSRVLTKSTKLIFVIHEFGFPNPKIEQLSKIAKERGITLVEDAAHSINTLFVGRKLGSWGDYIIHSLPKSLPISSGGILIAKKQLPSVSCLNHKPIRNEDFDTLSYLRKAKQKRRKLFVDLKSILVEFPQLYELEPNVNPFAFGFKSPNAKEINFKMEENFSIEMLRTHIKNEVVVPLNPEYTNGEIEYLFSSLKKCIK